MFLACETEFKVLEHHKWPMCSLDLHFAENYFPFYGSQTEDGFITIFLRWSAEGKLNFPCG